MQNFVKFAHADRKSVYIQEGLSIVDALKQECFNGKKVLSEEGLNGAKKFKKGFGRDWDFEKKNILFS